MKQIQTILLETQDGRKLRFSGPDVLKENDIITQIRFFSPIPLPQDYSWEDLEPKKT